MSHIWASYAKHIFEFSEMIDLVLICGKNDGKIWFHFKNEFSLKEIQLNNVYLKEILESKIKSFQ